MRRSLSASVLVVSFACVAACDADSPQHVELAVDEQLNEPIAQLDFDWSNVPVPTGNDPQPQYQHAPALPAMGQWALEEFHFTSEHFIALTQEPGNLFAPFPSGVEPLSPELSAGFFLGFEFLDESDVVVGFGSEQEILDFDNAVGETTYTLTFPERGALVLRHSEEFSYLFEEVADMIADQEPVRVFNPPLVHIHTVQGSAQVIGGTGEFAHAHGVWREISIINKLDLLTGLHDVGIVLQIIHN